MIDPDDLPYGPGNSDYEYDDARQSLLDALMEGREAGHLSLAAGLCPYVPSEPECREWHRGRLQVLIANAQLRRKVA